LRAASVTKSRELRDEYVGFCRDLLEQIKRFLEADGQAREFLFSTIEQNLHRPDFRR
jgi:hypothetical protein